MVANYAGPLLQCLILCLAYFIHTFGTIFLSQVIVFVQENILNWVFFFFFALYSVLSTSCPSISQREDVLAKGCQLMPSATNLPGSGSCRGLPGRPSKDTRPLRSYLCLLPALREKNACSPGSSGKLEAASSGLESVLAVAYFSEGFFTASSQER